MTTLTFTIEFHGPFAVSSGYPDDGLDHTIDRDDPLPQTQVRGLLRDHARHWLGLPKALVEEVFGSARKASPWVFSKPVIELSPVTRPDGVDPWVWNRVEVNERGRSKDNAMVVGQQAWATSGTFEVCWNGDGQAPPAHVLVLRAAARDIVSLGLNRRRGMGTVTITDDAEWTGEHTAALMELRKL